MIVSGTQGGDSRHRSENGMSSVTASLNCQPVFGSCPGSHGPLPKRRLNSFAVMPSSDVTTRKPGSDFDWSIITRPRPKAGGRVLKCSWFVVVFRRSFLGLPILHFGR